MDFTDSTDVRNPCYPCHPWLNPFLVAVLSRWEISGRRELPRPIPSPLPCPLHFLGGEIRWYWFTLGCLSRSWSPLAHTISARSTCAALPKPKWRVLADCERYESPVTSRSRHFVARTVARTVV